MLKYLFVFIFITFGINLSYGLDKEKSVNKELTKEEYETRRWNNILKLINSELKAIGRARKKTVQLQYRVFELMSEKVKLYKEKENKVFLQKKLKYGKKIKREDIFKKTLEHYKAANAYGTNLLKKYPRTKFKAGIYYTLALNSRDFSYDNKELEYLRKAIDYSKDQTKVNYLARTSLAEYYYNNKNWKSAIYQYELVISNKDDEWYSKNLLNYGWCLLKTHKFNDAINNLESSYKLSNDDFYVNVKEQAMTGLISFYVLGVQIQRGIDFINKYSDEKNNALLKLARKSSGKGHYDQAEKIVSSLESTISPQKETELYADLRLFQFELYNQFHKPQKLLNIAKLFPKTKFSEYQQEDAVRKISDVVGAKQVILKKDFSKYNKEYDKDILSEVITYFDILASIHPKEKAQYDYYKAETYYSVEQFDKALSEYKVSLVSYDKVPSKEDLRHKNLDAIFSCISTLKFNKENETIELEYAYTKYLSYWTNDKKAQEIYPRLFGLYLAKKDYQKTQETLDDYVKKFKKDKKKQQDLYTVMMDRLIKEEDTTLLAQKINLMQKGYLGFTKTKIQKSETILASILFKQLQKLKQEGKNREAIDGYQKIFHTEYYPKVIKGEAAFNMGMIYTDIEDNSNALKWYRKSFTFFSKKEIKEKRLFLEKMALRTSLLHNFLNASRLNKFILAMFCKEKDANMAIFRDAIKNDMANNYTTRALYTLSKYKVCVREVSDDLLKEMMVHFFENNEEKTLKDFISKYKLERKFPKEVSHYYEVGYWKHIQTNKSENREYLGLIKKLNYTTAKNFIIGLEQLKSLREQIQFFAPNKISINNKEPDPNQFIQNLTSRIDDLKKISLFAENIFQLGNGKISILVFDELIKVSKAFAIEVESYQFPINDQVFQKQFKSEMYKISNSMRIEAKALQDRSQDLIEKYEVLVTLRNESNKAYEILQVSDIRSPASALGVPLEVVK